MAFFFIVLYLILVLLRFHEYGATPLAFPILQLILALAFLFWLGERDKRYLAPQHGLILGLAGAIFMSIFIAVGWIGGAVTSSLDFLAICIFYFLVAATARTPARINSLMWAYCWCLFIVSLHSFDQFANGVGWTGTLLIENRVRYIGFLNDPNDLAAALVLALAFSVYLAFGPKSSWFGKILGLVFVPTYLACLYLTNSRGGILAVAAMIAAFYLLRKGKKLRSIFSLGIVGAGLMLLAPERASEISASEESAAERVDAWFAGLEMFKSHPLFGVGKDGFLDHHVRTAHNSFVLVLAELGAVGFFFWLSLIAISVWFLVRFSLNQEVYKGDPKAYDQRANSAQGRCLLVAMTGFLVASFFLSRSYTLILFFAIALSTAFFLNQRPYIGWASEFSLKKKFLPLVAIEVCGIIMIWLTVKVLLVLSK